MYEKKRYGAIDLKSFYASVECVERGMNPLTTKLVVADPTRTDKTICLAVSPALKAYGISGRARLFEVEQRIKEIQRTTGEVVEYITAPPRMALYTEYSARIFSIYSKFISPDDIHPYSIDEIFADLTPYLSLYGMNAHQLITAMIREVLQATGITATAGIGTNLYLAKIAMDILAKKAKPDKDGVRIAELNELSFREQLWDHQPITDFWRIGSGTAKTLEKHCIYTMGDLARAGLYQEDLLFRLFHGEAEILIDHAWGIEPCTIADIKAYKPKNSSLSSGQVLQEPYSWDKTRLIVKEMTELLVLDMVHKGLMTDKLTLTIGYDRQNIDTHTISGRIYTGRTRRDHYGRTVPYPAHGTANLGHYTASGTKLRHAILNLYDRITDPDLWVRRVTIEACDLTEKTQENGIILGEQLSLFGLGNYEIVDFTQESRLLEREQSMQETVVQLRKKFGKNAVLKAMNLEDGGTTMERNRQIGGHKA